MSSRWNTGAWTAEELQKMAEVSHLDEDEGYDIWSDEFKRSSSAFCLQRKRYLHTYDKEMFLTPRRKNNNAATTDWTGTDSLIELFYDELLPEAITEKSKQRVWIEFGKFLFDEFNLNVTAKAIADRRERLPSHIPKNARDKLDSKWLQDANPIWDLVQFVSAQKPVVVKCKKCEYETTLRIHHLDTLCQSCQGKITGWYTHKFFENNPEKAETPAILYWIRFRAKHIGNKVGITEKTTEKRGARYPDFDILAEYKLPLYTAWQIEQAVIRENKEDRNYPIELEGNGITECFKREVENRIEDSINRKISEFNRLS